MNRWPWLAEQPCRLPHKRHYEGRRDDVSKNLGHRNYQGIPTGNPWNPVVATPWPTETVLSRSLPPSLAKSLCLVIVNDEELPATRVVALARLGWSGYSEPTCFLACMTKLPAGRVVRASIVESIEVGLAMSHWVPSPKYDMDVYMTTLFGGEGLGILCWELGWA